MSEEKSEVAGYLQHKQLSSQNMHLINRKQRKCDSAQKKIKVSLKKAF